MTMTCKDCLHYEVCYIIEHYGADETENGKEYDCHQFKDRSKCAEQNRNGCGYCLEDREGYRRMFGAFSIHNPFHGREWTINTGHCKPRQIYFCPMCGRKLSEPPKEET